MSRKRVDLTGQTYGELTALYSLGIKDGSSYVWVVQCTCGLQDKVTVSGFAKKNKCSTCHDLDRKRFGKAPAIVELSKYNCNKCSKPLPINRRFNHLECIKDLDFNEDFLFAGEGY